MLQKLINDIYNNSAKLRKTLKKGGVRKRRSMCSKAVNAKQIAKNVQYVENAKENLVNTSKVDEAERDLNHNPLTHK